MGRQYEYCVCHKRKNEIELILGGHQVIKSENGFEGFKTFPSKKTITNYLLNEYNLMKSSFVSTLLLLA